MHFMMIKIAIVLGIISIVKSKKCEPQEDDLLLAYDQQYWAHKYNISRVRYGYYLSQIDESDYYNKQFNRKIWSLNMFTFQDGSIFKIRKIPQEIHISFYRGGSAITYMFDDESGQVTTVIMGYHNMNFFTAIKPNVWFMIDFKQEHINEEYIFLGSVQTPNVQISDVIFAEREYMLQKFPDHKDLIVKYT